MPCDFHRLGPPGTHTPWRAGILSIGSLSARVLIFLIVLRVHAGPDQLRGVRQGDDVHEAGHLSSCLPFDSGACVRWLAWCAAWRAGGQASTNVLNCNGWAFYGLLPRLLVCSMVWRTVRVLGLPPRRSHRVCRYSVGCIATIFRSCRRQAGVCAGVCCESLCCGCRPRTMCGM
jgi:hypothetical protein